MLIPITTWENGEPDHMDFNVEEMLSASDENAAKELEMMYNNKKKGKKDIPEDYAERYLCFILTCIGYGKLVEMYKKIKKE